MLYLFLFIFLLVLYVLFYRQIIRREKLKSVSFREAYISFFIVIKKKNDLSTVMFRPTVMFYT